MNNSVSDQKLNELLNQFALSPEDSGNNFNLGFYYESIGQTASAISYYLRSAERTKNVLEQYECLIRASMCFDSQGTRNFTVKGLLQHAISICPKRPEAYYLLSRFYENENKDGKWNYSFLIASIGEKVADFNSPSLRTEVDYPGKYAILYQKALAAWWCGLCDESRNIFNDLIQNYDLNEQHKNKVLENLKKFNETNKNLHEIYHKNKEEFDWGIFKNNSFMYECFKRDIIDQRQYEKFFEVEEGDIVLDVGASIGPFTYSVLNKNPELVICLEPHKDLFKTLQSNFGKNQNVICLNKGISTIDGEVIFHTLYDDTADQTSWEKNDSGYGISLKSLVKEYNLGKIDFLKIDCEGGEYDFFTEENFDWIVNNIKKISGEFHFYRDHTRERFIWFRDNYLTKFKNFSIFFVDNDGNFNDITDKVWDNDFFNTYGWVNIYIDNRSIAVNKLEGFPSVHFCTLEESKDRRQNLLKQFSEYNIHPKAHFFERNRENTHYGLTLSHLTMFYDWYHTTDEPYAIFCEDDVSLETVPNWNFTWKEFVNSLPEHWECIQLSLLCEVDSELSEVRLKPRLFQHWGTQIFLITREYAKKVLDRQHYDRQKMTYDFVVHGKPFLEPHVENLLFDSGTGGFIYNCPLFVESIYQFESTFDKSERPENYCGKNSYDLITKWWKEKGPTTKLSDIMKKPYKVVDFCSFYGPYGSEMLLLRYHTLKGYVDEFVISESSHSHTGIPVKFECKNKIKEWGLPEEKFKVIELQTPPDEELVIEQIDEMNCYDALSGNVQENIKSKYARVRDRLSKDALLQVLDDYDDNTVFIHGDIDEIINPSYIPNIADIFIKNFPHCFFYIPLIYLEGKADLRVYNKDWNCPESWDWAMFMCNKSLLKTVTPVQIRSNKLIPEGVGTFHLNNACTGERWTDVGWHFSWMGGKESRLIKKQSWEHRYDSFDWLVTKKYDDSDEFLSQEYKEGDTPPCGKVNLILKDFSKENLPEEIFELPVVENFLFPTNKKKRIVDFFPYFDATGRELLEFRIKLLNDYVDEFVICESNKTLSGIPIEFNLKEVIEELNLPKDKIRIIQLEIPEDSELQIEEIDRINVCSYNSNNLDNLNSLRARVRERLQQNSLLKVLDYYDDDTIFIVGHQDEIIIPEALSWVPNLIRQSEDTQIIRIPLTYLEGRADLMVVNKNDMSPLPWVTLFLATKKQLKNITPYNVRSNVLGDYQAVSPSENGEIIKELGWHFTWMGDFDRKITKCKSWTHYDDFNFKGFGGGTEKVWEVEQLKSRLSKFDVKEGDISPIWGNENLIYKKYPLEKLPKLIFEMPHIQEFLLPSLNKESKSINFDDIDWGYFDTDANAKTFIINEMFVDRTYTKFFDVEEGDVVFDIGASNGVFSISILDKNPKEIHCFEPGKNLFKSMQNNLKGQKNVILNCIAIGDYVNHIMGDNGNDNSYNTIDFKTYIKNNNVNKIDFLKIDCEGGEWSVFNEENYEWISKNVRKIAGEFHCFNKTMKDSFIKFRDLYLKNASNVNVFECSNTGQYGNDIGEFIWYDDYVGNLENWYCSISFEFKKDDQITEEEEKMFKISKISEKASQTCWVVDNFYENPDEVRKFALEQEYVEGGFGRGFIGRRTEKQFLFPGLKEKFEEIMGMKITKWQEHGMNGRFQNCHSGEALVYHCDSQKWGGMLYLTPGAPYQCGTTLYANKKTRARSYHDPGWNDAWDNMPGDAHLDRTPFEPVDVVGNVYNRLMIFDASCIHSASEYFGTVIENSRLWQMFFFDTEGYESFIY